MPLSLNVKSCPGLAASLEPQCEGWNVREIPSQYFHAFHSYFNESPWSPDGSRILYLGVNENGSGAICYWDMMSGKEIVLAEAPLFDWHLAANQFWALGGEAVIFRHFLSDGRRGLGLVELSKPGRVHILESFGFVELRHVVGAGEICHGGRRVDNGVTEVLRMSLSAMTAEVLFDSRSVSALMADKQEAPFHINHPVVEPASGRMFFKMMSEDPDAKSRFDSFWVWDPSSGFHGHGNAISGHPAWFDLNTIINIQSPRDGSDNRWVVAVDAISGASSRLIDNPFEGPGHPAISPDGKRIVIDAFVADGKTAPVYLIDTVSRRVCGLLRLPHHYKAQAIYDPKQLCRSQPHPAWNTNGKEVAFNCNHNGRRLRLHVATETGLS